MRVEARRRSGGIGSKVLLTLGAALLVGAGSAQAGTKYFADGAIQNSKGGWDLPKQGSCPADATAATRPDCIARRFNAADTAACTALGKAGYYSWSTGVCTDTVNTTQAACQKASDRYWNANGVCAVVMGGKDEDRNAVGCAQHGGTWVTTGACTGSWLMPSRTDPAYGPGGLWVNDSATTGAAGTGDQCLRCHNVVTQYNNPRVRDVEGVIQMGHKNMVRPVSPTFKPWGGPPFACTGHPTITDQPECWQSGGTWDPTIYPSNDTGDLFSWNTNKITVGSNAYDLKWIYGDWLSPLPRAIYTGASLANMSYSCGRCHTTGWTSDAGTAPNVRKHPEADFPGITWTGTGTTGQVKLGGGVAGDPNIMSSWDEWGISCSRCHYSAVDDTTSAPSFAAPAGMGTHNNGMTSPDNNSGVCTDPRWSSAPSGSTLEALCASTGGSFLTACSANPTPAVCTAAANTSAKCAAVTGATWVAAASGWCSNAFYSTSASCTANSYTWTDGWCTTADAKAACTGGTGDAAKTWRLNGTMASCLVAKETWTYSRCSVEGFCNKGACSDTKYTNASDCRNAGAYWSPIQSKTVCENVGGQFAYATDVVTCGDAGGKWSGNRTNRGQLITSVCMQCHRQETSGYPDTNGSCSVAGKLTQGACIAGGGTWAETGNGMPLTVGPYHSTVAFPSHPHSNQFLNSPHAKFVGKFSEIATGKLQADGKGKYQSGWMGDFGEAGNTGNGCTGCHNVHQSTVPSVGAKPFRDECNVCHHNTSLRYVNHPSGTGTPLEKMDEEPMEACVTCHMPGGLHLFRINPDAAYSTFPMPQAMAANTAANTAPDGTYTNAVWVDLDMACGQCHGGGTQSSLTTGTIVAGSATLNLTGGGKDIKVGEKIRVQGAGAYQAPGLWADFDTYAKAVAGDVVTLAGTATHGVTNAFVEQNATNGAGWKSKADLAASAKSMHNDHPYASFTAKQGADTMTVAVDASASKCAGKASNCEVIGWSFGDGSANDTGVKLSHTYAKAGTYVITLTIGQHATGNSSTTQSFTAKAIAGAPTVKGSCIADYPSWSVNCSLNVPESGYKLVSVDFGDGASPEAIANPSPGTLSFSHSYQEAGNYSVNVEVVNDFDLQDAATIGKTFQGAFISAMPSISGRILNPGGEGVGGAEVSVASGNYLVANTLSRGDGSYTTGPLKPGTYTLVVTKGGFDFANPYASVKIGPSATNQNAVARAQ